jgi:hypothetical protein
VARNPRYARIQSRRAGDGDGDPVGRARQAFVARRAQIQAITGSLMIGFA